jgi:hypothetical protein
MHCCDWLPFKPELPTWSANSDNSGIRKLVYYGVGLQIDRNAICTWQARRMALQQHLVTETEVICSANRNQ